MIGSPSNWWAKSVEFNHRRRNHNPQPLLSYTSLTVRRSPAKSSRVVEEGVDSSRRVFSRIPQFPKPLRQLFPVPAVAVLAPEDPELPALRDWVDPSNFAKLETAESDADDDYVPIFSAESLELALVELARFELEPDADNDSVPIALALHASGLYRR